MNLKTDKEYTQQRKEFSKKEDLKYKKDEQRK